MPSFRGFDDVVCFSSADIVQFPVNTVVILRLEVCECVIHWLTQKRRHIRLLRAVRMNLDDHPFGSTFDMNAHIDPLVDALLGGWAAGSDI